MIDKLPGSSPDTTRTARSIVALDGPPGSIVGTKRAGLGEIWITDRTPADNRNPADAGARPVRLEPPVNGSIFRFFVLAPTNKQLSRQQLEEQAADGFRASGASIAGSIPHGTLRCIRRGPSITLILLRGDVTLVLDQDEVRLKPSKWSCNEAPIMPGETMVTSLRYSPEC